MKACSDQNYISCYKLRLTVQLKVERENSEIAKQFDFFFSHSFESVCDFEVHDF